MQKEVPCRGENATNDIYSRERQVSAKMLGRKGCSSYRLSGYRRGCEQGGWPCVGSSPQGPEGNKSQWPVVCCTTRALALDQFHPGSVPQLRKYAESKGLSSKVLLTLDNVLANPEPHGSAPNVSWRLTRSGAQRV